MSKVNRIGIWILGVLLALRLIAGTAQDGIVFLENAVPSVSLVRGQCFDPEPWQSPDPQDWREYYECIGTNFYNLYLKKG